MKYVFQNYKNVNTDKYDILISTSLFSMRFGYKNFKLEYVNKFIKWFSYIPKNAYVRLYIDGSVVNEPSFTQIIDNNYENLEIISYCFEEFLRPNPLTEEEDGLYHDGTFGTMIRFLPLYKNFRPKNIKYVWVTDMDMSPKVFKNNYIYRMEKQNIDVLFYSKGCYDKPWVSKNIKYPVVANKIIVSDKVKLNIKHFFTFLQDVIDYKYVNMYNLIVEKFKTERREIKDVKYFPYGFDELFLNTYIIKEFARYKRIILFDIGLSLFLPMLPKKEYNEIRSLYFASQEFDKPVKKETKKYLIKLNDKLYQKYKNGEYTEVYNLCLRDYEENYKKIDLNEIGITAVVIKNPGQY